jgi:hypothetical protein
VPVTIGSIAALTQPKRILRAKTVTTSGATSTKPASRWSRTAVETRIKPT